MAGLLEARREARAGGCMGRRTTVRGLMLAVAEAALLLGGHQAGRRTERALHPPPVMVMITRNGDRYHLPGCRLLRKGGVPTPLDDVKAGGRYQACRVCRPPK